MGHDRYYILRVLYLFNKSIQAMKQTKYLKAPNMSYPTPNSSHVNLILHKLRRTQHPSPLFDEISQVN